MEKQSKLTELTETADKKADKPWLFKKGQSGNPAGKPKGLKNFETDFLSAVADIAKTKKITRKEAMKILLKKAFTEAEEGIFPFYKDIHDRIYGKAVERHEITGPEGRDLFQPTLEEKEKADKAISDALS